VIISTIGWPDKVIEHGSVDELFEKYGLNPEGPGRKDTEKSLKDRLDIILVQKGFFTPPEKKAKAAIMAGIVYVDNQRVDKAGNPRER